MSQVIIENPIINSPFDEPTRHFRFTDEGITDEIVDARRTSSYFVPIARPKKKGSKQLQFDTEWTQDRIEENKLANDIRRRVALWRKGSYVGVTPTTARPVATGGGASLSDSIERYQMKYKSLKQDRPIRLNAQWVELSPCPTYPPCTSHICGYKAGHIFWPHPASAGSRPWHRSCRIAHTDHPTFSDQKACLNDEDVQHPLTSTSASFLLTRRLAPQWSCFRRSFLNVFSLAS